MYILLLEDDPEISDFIICLLEEAGHTVDLATSAEDALPAILASPPELLLCDYHLAGTMRGDELIAHVRRDATTHTLPIIFSSANHPMLRRTRQHWLDLAVTILPKPYTCGALVEALEAACAAVRTVSP